jgi:fatty-acyl-CoA synthase
VHRGGFVPLLGATIDVKFREVVERFPQHEAVVSLPQGARRTYAQLDMDVEEVARGLMGLGVEAGDRVGIWSTDNLEWIIVQMATARIGAVLVTINPAYRIGELRHALAAARVRVLMLIPSFRSSHYARMVTELCPECTTCTPDTLDVAALPELRHLVIYDPADPAATVRPQPGFLTWRDLVERGRDVPSHAVAERGQTLDPDDPINIQFTSGTTGAPKPVVLTQHNILNNGYFTGAAMRFSEHDRLCVPVPFYHCFGMVVSTLACLTHGAALIIPSDHFEPGATLDAIEREQCTAVHGVPTMFIAELEQKDLHERDLSSLRTGIMAGAPCPPELVRRVMNEMGCRELLIAYGQTESSPVTHITHPDDSFERRTQTVGTNLPHQEVKIVDPDSGVVVPIGTAGEICFRGYHVMRGYDGQPEATREVIDEAGWLHSGDIGVLDEDGYLRITGRLKDMIIRGGENIYPAEIEALYQEHPAVAAIAVFGVADERLGETVGAWVQLHADAEADPESLRQYGREHLARFKVPEHIWIVDEFPMTVTGKIQKFRIREIVEAQLREEAVPC